jgi:hypothetical protein
MTTGRINQVTIERQGAGQPDGSNAAGEISVTGRHRWGAPSAASSAEASGAASGSPLSPSSFPRAGRPRRAALSRLASHRVPQEEGLAPRSVTPWRHLLRGRLPPVARVQCSPEASNPQSPALTGGLRRRLLGPHRLGSTTTILRARPTTEHAWPTGGITVLVGQDKVRGGGTDPSLS